MLQSSGSYLPDNYFDQISHYISDADITFGNYEGTICSTDKKSWKCKGDKVCYAFKSNLSVLDHLLGAGFDIMSIANNHIYDYGEYCANQTKKNLEDAGILPIGLRAKKASPDESSTQVIKVGRLKVAFAAFHYSQGWGRLIAVSEYARIKKLIKNLSKKSDIVVVSFHGGDEGKNALYVANGVEEHYRSGEKRGNLRKFSRVAIDAGADLVLGHGPHVPRGMEIYKNKLVAYSLSNFATPWGFNLRNPMNIGYVLSVDLDEKDGSFLGGQIIPTVQSKNPISIKLDNKNRAINLIKKLTTEDFNSSLVINNDGQMYAR